MFKFKVLWINSKNEDKESVINALDYHDVDKKLRKRDKNYRMITIRNLGEVK